MIKRWLTSELAMTLLPWILVPVAILSGGRAAAQPTDDDGRGPVYSYCTQNSTGYPTYHPCPGDVTGPLRGGGNHRWTDGSDD